METKSTINWVRVTIVTGIALIAAGVFYWIGSNYNIPESTSSVPTATTDKTASWKTYTSEKYGFSFKYPQKYVETANSSAEEIILSTSKDDHWIADIKISSVTATQTIAGILDTDLASKKQNGGQFEVSDIKIGGKSAKKYVQKNPTDVGDEGAVVINGSSAIKIYGDTSSSDLFNGIVSTFKFTK